MFRRPDTIASSGTDDPDTTPKFSSVAGSRSGVTSDMQVVKLALNYRWDQDPAAAWADAPVFAVAVMPVKAARLQFCRAGRSMPAPAIGTAAAREKNTQRRSDSPHIAARPTANLTGQSGEFFARVDTPSRVFVKGFVGTGALIGGKGTDEDWGNATGRQERLHGEQ